MTGNLDDLPPPNTEVQCRRAAPLIEKEVCQPAWKWTHPSNLLQPPRTHHCQNHQGSSINVIRYFPLNFNLKISSLMILLCDKKIVKIRTCLTDLYYKLVVCPQSSFRAQKAWRIWDTKDEIEERCRWMRSTSIFWQNSNPCTGSLILGSSVWGSSSLDLGS